MIPVLYPSDETIFKTNGIGRLTDAISCKVVEERNGIYEAELVYPMTGQHYKDIKEGCILWVIHDDTKIPQPFDIYSHTAPINGVVTFRAHHISYRQSNIIVKPFTATSAAEALAKIPGNSANPNPFQYWTDKETVGNFSVKVPISVKEILGGTAGSILDTYGKAEYEWDKFTVKLYLNRGVDTGVQIRYGKNLSDITQEYDISRMYSAVAPYWMSIEGDIVMLPEVLVFSDDMPMETGVLITHNNEPITVENGEEILYTSPIVHPVPLDLSGKWDEKPTEEMLRREAKKSLEDGWTPDENIRVDFVQLWQTDEYENVAPLQRVRLCDKVSVYFPDLGIVAKKQKVIRVEYNVLLERYDSMELGKAQTSFSDAIRAKVETEILQTVPTQSSMQWAIDHATQLISGGLGGHVVIGTNSEGQPNEVLIMDTDNILTAVNVLRLNVNGIGFSNTGYDGVYRSAWTLDGHFVADFIDTGTFTANIIKAGILSDSAGKHYWNMLTGEMQIGNIHVGDNQIYSGNKSTFASTENGFYIGSNGDFNIGDANSYLKWSSTANTLDMKVTSLSIGGVTAATTHDTDEAAKTATNYLYYDSDGLVIRMNESSASGYNTKITAQSIDFRSGDTVLASIDATSWQVLQASTQRPLMSVTTGNNSGIDIYHPGTTYPVMSVKSGQTEGMNFYQPGTTYPVMSIKSGQTDGMSFYQPGTTYKIASSNTSGFNVHTGTVGNINVANHAIYSGSKSSFSSTSEGFYLDDDGKMCVGDANSYIKYNSNDGKITMKVTSLSIGGVNAATTDDTAEAAKTATNYLNYDSTNGLVVSTSASTTTGYNTQIKNDGIYFRHGTTVKGEISEDGYTIYRGSGVPAMSITASALSFYKSNGSTVTASITNKGFDVISGTIGDINIDTDSLYSGLKSTYRSTEPGFFFGSNGNICIGNDLSYIKWDNTAGTLSLNVSSISIAGNSVATGVDITEAAKTATNYLYYDGTEGLVVSTSGRASTGYNTQITANGINFRRGATVLSEMTDSSYTIYRGSNAAMTLDSTSLKFYKRGSTDAAAEIGANGLTVYYAQIGGFEVGSNYFSYNLGDFEISPEGHSGTYCGKSGRDWVLTIKNDFGVTQAGKLYATDADISGKITADDGNIAGWTISENKITGKTIELDSANGWLKFGSFTATTGRTSAYIDKAGDGSLGTIYFTQIGVGELQLEWGFYAGRSKAEMNVRCDFTVAPRFSNLSTSSTHEARFLVSSDGTYGTLALGSGSSIRYKDVLRDMTAEDVEKAYKIQPVIAKMKKGYLDERDERFGKYYPMLVAENVDEYLPDAADHMNGMADNWNVRVMIPVHHQMLIDQHNQINALQSTIKALQDTINMLKQAAV